jgi:hypothetical protein
VQTYPQLESGPGCRLDDRLRTSDRSCRAVERDDESVPCRVHFATSKAAQLVAYGLIVLV